VDRETRIGGKELEREAPRGREMQIDVARRVDREPDHARHARHVEAVEAGGVQPLDARRRAERADLGLPEVVGQVAQNRGLAAAPGEQRKKYRDEGDPPSRRVQS